MEFGLSADDLKAVEKTFQDHLALGKNFIEFKNYEEAVKELEQALLLKPQSEDTLWQLAKAHQQLWNENKTKKYKEEALRYARLCLKTNPQAKKAAELISLLTNKIKTKSVSSEEENTPIKTSTFLKYTAIIGSLALLLSGGIMWFSGIDLRSFLPLTSENQIVKNIEKFQIINSNQQSLNSIAASPKADYFASAGDDKTIKIWNTQTRTAIQTLQGHTEAVLSVAFSLDGEALVSGSKDKTLKIWNFKTGANLLNLTGHTDFVNYVNYSPDGRLIVSASSDKQVKIWEVQSGKCLKTLSGHQDQVNVAVFSPDGLYILSGGNDKAIKLWNVAGGNLLKTFYEHTDAITSLSFTGTFWGNGHYSGQGYHFVSGGKDNKLIRWKTYENVERVNGANGAIYANYIINAKTENKVNLEGLNKRFVFAQNREYFCLFGNDTVSVFHYPSMNKIKSFPLKSVYSQCFADNDNQLILGSLDGKIYLYNFDNDKIIATLKPDPDQYGNYSRRGSSNIILSPDDEQVYIFGGEFNTINTFDFKRGKKLQKFKIMTPHYLKSLIINKSGKYLYGISGSSTHSILKIDSQNGLIINTLTADIHNSEMTLLAISNDNKYLASGDNSGKLVIWDLEKNEVLQVLQSSEKYAIDKFAFSPNDKYLASYYEGKVKLWDYKNGKELMAWESRQIGNLTFSPDSKKIITVGWYANNQVFDIESKKSQEVMQGKYGAIKGLDYSPNGKYLALSDDKNISLFDAKNFTFIKNLEGHKGTITFSNDGKYLLSFYEEEVKVWKLKE
jgi:WD40 repeat protein